MNPRDLHINVRVTTHGALEDGRKGVILRTLALWCLAAAQWLLRSRLTVRFEQEDHR